MLTHDQVVAATKSAAELENTISDEWSFVRRILWLTEAELAARMHTVLTRSGVASPEAIRMNAQGRLASGATNHDLEVFTGTTLTAAVEVLYCRAAKGADDYKQQPAKPLNDDVSWLISNQACNSRHVVAFLPRMMPGYSVPKNRRPFSLAGQPFDLPEDKSLLGGVLQATSLSDAAKQMFAGIFREVAQPASGNDPRWTLVDVALPEPGDLNVDQVAVRRTVVLSPTSPIWAVVLSRA